MARLFPILAACGCVLLSGGCANVNQISKDREVIPFRAFPAEGKAAIYLWPPYTSAAIVDGHGNRCVLGASGAQTVEARSEAALKAGDVIGKIANLDVQTKGLFLEAFKQISAADSRASFVDLALFHLCLLDQNGTFTKHKDGIDNMAPGAKGPEVLKAYNFVIQEAAKMVK